MAASIEQFIQARRALLQWRLAKQEALCITELHFPKTHPLRKCVANLCNGECLGEFRFQADNATCRHADQYGDEAFQIHIDGVNLQSPVDLFYGHTLQYEPKIPEIKISPCVSIGKRLTVVETSKLRDLANHAELFMRAVKHLQSGCHPRSALRRRLIQCEARFKRLYQNVIHKLREVKIDHQITYAILICLMRQSVPAGVSMAILNFIL